LGRHRVKIGVLTSSRADYGIYKPLLQKMKEDANFDLEIIAFGMHLSKKHGYTINEILADKYQRIHKVCSIYGKDDKEGISKTYAKTALEFSKFWSKNTYDLVICLGDRFEMSAAVQAGIPHEIKFVHIHGGETTKGSIDNIYRHQLTLASSVHLTSTDQYKKKVTEILGNSKNIFSVGSISLDDIKEFKPINKEQFHKQHKIPLSEFALVTFHPETINSDNNFSHCVQIEKALEQLAEDIHLVITMPNADTLGSEIRKSILKLRSLKKDKCTVVENFGKDNYFNAMKYCKFLIGNSSSGIIEAASFNKYVVNVGRRQEGRAQSQNVLNSKFDHRDIISKSLTVKKLGLYKGENIYYKRNVVKKIINIISKLK
jgi:GDP/UDP-N,N'-diacetylbacillosamine 2-epimerase (hydrolysing)